MTPISFTQHALEQWVRRWAPSLTLTEARRELAREAHQARPLRARTPAGQEQWPSGPVLVMKRDAGQRGVVCVTVLPRASEASEAEEPLA